MDEQYYWIEMKFPSFGFWGTVFKFWLEAKRIKEKVSHKIRICAFGFANKNKIRSPA